MKHLSFFCLMFAMVGINGQMAGMPEQHVNVFEKTLIKTQSLEKPSKAPDQGTIYFEEDFSGSGIYPPAGWTSTPAMNREWLMSSGVGNTTPRYGNRMATIDFSLLHPLDAWLFSPAITLTAGNRYEIGFWVHMPGSTATSLDQLKVQIAESTTVTDGAMDGDILYINTTTRIQTWTWITATYTAKTTGNHHIGFHAFNNTFTGSRISIDYVSVTDVPVVRTNDLALTAVDPFIFPYTQVPTGDLVQSVTWTPAAATVTNVGSTPQSNVNVALTLNGAPLATSSSVDILNPGASEVVTFNSQTFSAVNGQIETFNLTYTAQADLPDDDPSDNTVTYTAGTVIGTNYTFAQNATTIGTNNAIGNGGTRGNIFTITNEVTLGQVSVALGGTIVMVNYNVVLYKLKSDDDTIDGAALFTIAGQRPVSNTPWAWFNHLLPNNGFVLEPGRYFLGVNQPSTTGIILLADGTPRSGYSLNAANGDLTNTGHGAFAVTMGLKGAGLFLCSNPTELTVLETMPTSARFSWKGESGNYTFSLHNNATGALINQAIVTDPSSFSVSGLSVNTEYRWSVAANCAGNLSEAVWGTPFRTATNMTRYAVTAFVQGNGNNLTTTHSIGNITVQNRGTLQTSGTISIPATLEVNGVIVGRENITSTTTTNWAVNGNRTNYQFPTLRANLSAPGEHTVRVWLNHPADTTVPVDTFSKVIVNTVLDAGATEIVGYIDGDYTNLGATEMLKIKVKNHGPTKTHGFQVNASVNGIRLSPSNTVIWNFAAHALESGEEREYTFEQPLNLLQHDLGTTGTYVIRAWARHNTADLDASNDTVTVTITNTNYKDLEAVAITHPISGANLTATESVTIHVRNNGTYTVSNAMATLYFDDVFVATESLPVLAPGAATHYTFTARTFDLSADGLYSFSVKVNYEGDQNPNNDSLHEIVRIAFVDVLDATVEDLLTPVSGDHLSTAEIVTARVRNVGTLPITNMPIYLQINGGTPIEEAISAIDVGRYVDHTFTTTADLSAIGEYTIKIWCDNDTLERTIHNMIIVDIAVSDILEPASTNSVNAVPVTLTVRNNGTNRIENLPIYMTHNGGTPVMGTISGIDAKSQISYTFMQRLALMPGDNDVVVYVAVPGDLNTANDTVRYTITNTVNVNIFDITAPTSGYDLGMETVTVVLENTGSFGARNISASFWVNDNLITTETIDSVGVGANSTRRIHSFMIPAPLSEYRTHAVRVAISLPGNTATTVELTRMVVNTDGVANVPYFEGFEGTTGNNLPITWSRSTTGTSGFHTSNGPLPFIQNNVQAYEGSRFMAANWQSENVWAYSQGIRLTAGTAYIARFYYLAPGSTAYEQTDNFAVYIAQEPTATAMLASADTILHHFGKRTVTWTLAEKIFTPTITGTYYFGFNKTTPGGEYVAIDNVSIVEMTDNNLIINPKFPYTQVPKSQFPASATATNTGALPQTNVKLSATLNGAVIGTSIPIASLAPGATSETMTVSTTTEIPEGSNTLILAVSSDAANEGTESTASFTFTGTTNVFAVDALTEPTAVGYGGTSTITFANVFEVTKQTTFTGSQLLFSTQAGTQAYTVSIYRMTGTLSTEAIPLAAKSANRTPGEVILDFDHPVTLMPGYYALALTQSGGQNILISYDGRSDGGWYLHSGTTLTHYAGGQAAGALAIRMIIDDDFVTPVGVVSVSPTNNATNVAIDAEVKVTFNQPITGGTLTDITFSPNVEGIWATIDGNSLIISHNDFAEGIQYTVTVPAGAIEKYESTITWTFTTVQGSGLSLLLENNIIIYPNPVKDELNIQTEQIITQIVVLDLQGKVVKLQQGNSKTIDLQMLPMGNYIVRIHTETTIIPVKIVKQ